MRSRRFYGTLKSFERFDQFSDREHYVKVSLDGSYGGYAIAAKQMKERLNAMV